MDYRPEPALAMLVPAEMKEPFADVPNATVKTFRDRPAVRLGGVGGLVRL